MKVSVWKLVWNATGAGCLFNVASDPGEHADLAAQQPQRVAAMNAVRTVTHTLTHTLSLSLIATAMQILQEEAKAFFQNTDRGHNSPLCPAAAEVCVRPRARVCVCVCLCVCVQHCFLSRLMFHQNHKNSLPTSPSFHQNHN